MVMHARKRPRINDGYFDQVDNHEKVDKYVDRSYGRKQYDRRGDREDYLFHQEKESPRLTRKLPYIDRLQPDKEKDKNDRHRRDTERFSYEERRSRSRDCSYNIQSKEHTDDGSSSESPSHSRRSRDRELLSRQDHSDDGSHEEDGSKSQTKEQRTEGQKVALRSCGDWSEHLSSSGKRYFYNCKTEVSQWVKPKEWTLDDSMKEKPGTVSNGKNLDTNYSHKTSKLISDSPRREYTKNTEDSIRHRSNHDRSSRELRDTRENNRSSKKQYDRNTEDSHSESSSPRSSTGDTRSPNHSESPGSVTNNGVIAQQNGGSAYTDAGEETGCNEELGGASVSEHALIPMSRH